MSEEASRRPPAVPADDIAESGPSSWRFTFAPWGPELWLVEAAAAEFSEVVRARFSGVEA